MEIKALVRNVLCICTGVTRTTWDESRKCFRYTATMKPKSETSDNIFQQMDMFSNDFRIPLRDEVLRRKSEYAALAANNSDDDAKLAAWDKVVSSQLTDKEAIVHTCTLSVSQLTDGKFSSYVLQIGKTSYEVTSRTISSLGDIEAAVGRVSNQVMRACKEQESEGE